MAIKNCFMAIIFSPNVCVGGVEGCKPSCCCTAAYLLLISKQVNKTNTFNSEICF